MFDISTKLKELPPYDIQDYITILFHYNRDIAEVLNDKTKYIVNWEWCYGHPYPPLITDKILFKNNQFIS
ncbi:hypothetical protein MHK_009964, partial [Candidatus Magnetomorum sp. HK-1]